MNSGDSGAIRRWIGIDEAGYGPNLGPLVMTAVVAEGTGEARPDPWTDLPEWVCRAGGPAGRLWLDDSKRLYKAGRGLERLRDATLAVLRSTGAPVKLDDVALLDCTMAGDLEGCELAGWLKEPRPMIAEPGGIPVPALATERWRIQSVRSRVVGPRRFNALLEAHENKAAAHGRVFLDLLAGAWGEAGVTAVEVVGDKHGGRHAYYAMLVSEFDGAWIERGEEGPVLSRYQVRDGPRRMSLELKPKADRDDALVALASIVSKYLRERWMAAFNAFWTERVAGLRPTAGYPLDARRFRAEIETEAQALGFRGRDWWRER